MAWDFTVDSEIQTELANNLKEKADAFDAQVKNMYGKIGNLSLYWRGEDYDAFLNGTQGYKPALQDLSDGIRMYANHFDKLSDGTEQLAKELIDIVNNMAMFDSPTTQYATGSNPNSNSSSGSGSSSTPSPSSYGGSGTHGGTGNHRQGGGGGRSR